MRIHSSLEPDHRRAIAALLAETPEFNAGEVATALELVDEALHDPTSTYRFLLAEDAPGPTAGELLGYICYGQTPMTRATVDLYWLVVGAAHRRRGVGRELCRALEEKLAAEGTLTLRVETGTRPLYEPTIRFYRSIGYADAGRIPDFYDEGDDLLILTRRLARP